MQIGIVGLPNVGKSTLFNALTKSSNAESSNYPFCTIDPNVGVVEVPDHRFNEIVKIVNPEKTIRAVVEFVDIAGLVKGASKGEGLGNQFLANIRNCNAIAQVIRFFEDDSIIHVDNNINPKSDMDTIEAELIIKDLETVEKSLAKAQGEAKTGKKEAISKLETIEKFKSLLESGKRSIKFDLSDDENEILADLHLLTSKPILYIANVSEDGLQNFDKQKAKKDLGLEPSDCIVPICAKLESELADMSDDEAKEFLSEFGINSSGKDELIRSAYRTLDLETYFTAGVKEVRAWTIKKGYSAPQAAGVIHTDFEKGFICADIVNWKDLVESGGESKAKEKGLVKMQGKEYIVQDGDVCHFKFNV